MGQRLGVDNFYKYFEAFGFTEKTGIDLPAETQPKAGVTYHVHEGMTLIDLASSSFGQSFQVTPIQMVTALSAIANGGKLMKPYVVAKVLDDNGNVVSETQPTVRRQVISEETSAKVAEMMRRVVNEGTAKTDMLSATASRARPVLRRSSARPASTSRPTAALPPRTIRRLQ